MITDLIDTHAHLDDEQFSQDLPDVLQRAKQAGLSQVITIGTTLSSSRACVALAQRFRLLKSTVGIQPNNVATSAPGDWDGIVSLLGAPEIVGLGESGLDRHWKDTPFEQQQDYFQRHLDLAHAHHLPVVIHCREAETDVVAMLRRQFDRLGPVRGVMHSFTGTMETAAACLEMGLFISFAGILTFKNAGPLRDVTARIPVDRLLIETDCPYLSPAPLRGRRNEPAHLVHTLHCLAGLLGQDAEALAAQLTSNARQLFG